MIGVGAVLVKVGLTKQSLEDVLLWNSLVLFALVISRQFMLVRELDDREEELSYQASHDALTCLPNRTLFWSRLGLALTRNTRATRRELVMVMFVDLDDFKQVNDTQGHGAGDELLIEVAARLRSVLRENDVAARLGGDEFGVIIRNLRGMDDAVLIATRLLTSLKEPIELSSGAARIGGTAGIVLVDPEASSVPMESDEVLRRADLAMYEAKAAGKGTFRIYGEPAPLRASYSGSRLVDEDQSAAARNNSRQ